MRAAALALLATLVAAPAAAAEAGIPGGRALVVRTSVSPETHLFAEPVVARVDVVVDPALLDPDALRVSQRFAPYQPIRPTEETRRRVGELVHLRYSTTLRCLHVGCIAPRFRTDLGEQEGGRAERHTFRLPAAEVRDGNRLLLTKGFPPIEVVSRANTARLDDVNVPPFIARSVYVASLEPPPPTYRVPPTLLAALALAGAFALLLFPAVLVGRAARARWVASRRPRPLSPLERALVLVDWTARREDGEEDRRKALELLADVLERGGAGSLAETTRELAWAEQSPDRSRSGELAAEAKRTLAGGGNGRPS